MPARFITPVSASTENSFTAQGIPFEYLTLDGEVAAGLIAEAEAYKIKFKTDIEIDHDEYGEHSGGSKLEYVDLTSLATLSDTVSYSRPAGDIIVENGHVTGVVIYIGKNTDRYGYYSTVPISADPYYNIEYPMMRPSKGEVTHDFCILYTDGTVVGDNHGHYTSWEERQIEYYDFHYSLARADELQTNN